MPWPVFPQCPAYGFTKRADYSVTIVERASGIRSVNRNWYYPLHVFSAVPIGDKQEDDIHKIARFWHAIGGQAGQFLFTDYTDYKSANTLAAAVTRTDQPLIESDDSPGSFQLTKLYEDDEFLFQQQRIIQKPKPGTILIAEDGVLLTETTDYVVDYDTGLVDILSPGGSGTVYTWGGEFYVTVMFESTPEFMIVDKAIQQTGFALRELRLPT
jgi:uncharacterized protein (TIGR02217 family)